MPRYHSPMDLEILSRHPAGAAHRVPLLFVHGAWHGAWCWAEHFLDFFAAQGCAAHAVSLRGHGASAGHERLRRTRIADYVADVAAVAATLPQPPVLIGHSMGGLVVQKFLERHTVPGAVLLAPVPPSGVLGTTLRLARRHPLIFVRVNLTLSLYPLVATPRLARECFFSDNLPDAQVNACWEKLQDESFRAFVDMLALDLPRPIQGSTPMLVLGAGKDTIFTPAEVSATAAAWGAELEILPNIAHDMMLEPQWQAVAMRISEWLGRTQSH